LGLPEPKRFKIFDTLGNLLTPRGLARLGATTLSTWVPRLTANNTVSPYHLSNPDLQLLEAKRRKKIERVIKIRDGIYDDDEDEDWDENDLSRFYCSLNLSYTY